MDLIRLYVAVLVGSPIVEMQSEFILVTHSSWVGPRTCSSQRCGSSDVVEVGGDMMLEKEKIFLEKDTLLKGGGNNLLLGGAKAEIRRTADEEDLELIMDLKTMVLAIVEAAEDIIYSLTDCMSTNTNNTLKASMKILSLRNN